jgi:hypothetical protein
MRSMFDVPLLVRSSQTAARPLPPYALDAERRAMSTAARPSTISASGIGHHQCSPKAARPWALSRPAQKTPRSRRTAPTTWPIRRMVTKYYQRRRSCECAGTVARKLSPSPQSNLTDLLDQASGRGESHQDRSLSAVILWDHLGTTLPAPGRTFRRWPPLVPTRLNAAELPKRLLPCPGVKGSPVQIRPSRLVVELFRKYLYPTRVSKRAISS